MTNLSIMFSGGLDSLISLEYALQNGYRPQAIFVDMGQSNSKKEIISIKNRKDGFSPHNIIFLNFSDLVPLIENRLSNQIIPSRNLFLSTIGSMFNERVWINALDGEQNGKEHDKSLRFFQDATNILSYTNNFFQESTIVETPFGHLSKAETINWALKNDIPKDVLFDTTSCYNGKINKCGVCLTCYKRKVAFLLNGIDEPGYENDPLKSKYASEVDREIKNAFKNKDYTRFTKKRMKEHFMLINGEEYV